MRESRIPLWESGFHAFLASRLLNAGVVPSWLCAMPSFLERHSVRTVEDLDKVPLLGCSHWIAPFLIVPAGAN